MKDKRVRCDVGGGFLTAFEMTVSVVLMLFLTSCGKNIDYKGLFFTFNESVDERFAQSMEYNGQHGYDVYTGIPDEYEVYAMSDIHVDFSTDNLDRYVSDYLADTLAPPFSLCLGDVINAGIVIFQRETGLNVFFLFLFA